MKNNKLMVILYFVSAFGVLINNVWWQENRPLLSGDNGILISERNLAQYVRKLRPNDAIVTLFCKDIVSDAAAFEGLVSSERFQGIALEMARTELCVYLFSKGSVAAQVVSDESILSQDVRDTFERYSKEVLLKISKGGIKPLAEMSVSDLEMWWRTMSGGKGGIVAPSSLELQSAYSEFITYILGQHFAMLVEVVSLRYGLHFSREIIEELMAAREAQMLSRDAQA